MLSTRVAGDITTPVGKAHFTIECKKEKDGTWIRLLKVGAAEMVDSVHQGWRTCCFTSFPNFCKELKSRFTHVDAGLHFNCTKEKENNFNYLLYTRWHPLDRVIVSLDNFAKAFTPDNMLEALRIE